MEGSLLGTTKLLWKGPKALRPSKNTLQVSMISSVSQFSQHMPEGMRPFNTPSATIDASFRLNESSRHFAIRPAVTCNLLAALVACQGVKAEVGSGPAVSREMDGLGHSHRMRDWM